MDSIRILNSAKWIRIIGGLNLYTVPVGVVLAMVFLACLARTTMDQHTLNIRTRIEYSINKAFDLEETVASLWNRVLLCSWVPTLSGNSMNSRTIDIHEQSPSSVIG